MILLIEFLSKQQLFNAGQDELSPCWPPTTMSCLRLSLLKLVHNPQAFWGQLVVRVEVGAEIKETVI